jgi:alpha-D-ribose 1-methylphosphonate 5-triphosphate synthase subunit PhnH
MAGAIPAGGPRQVPAALAERLFPDVPREDLTLNPSPRGSRSLVLARLLEDGDRNDLAWLFAALPESEVAAWLGLHGGRKLSRRSAAYWQTVLGVAAGAPATDRADLWPL